MMRVSRRLQGDVFGYTAETSRVALQAMANERQNAMAGTNNILGGGGLHHVAVRTDNMHKSVDFYTQVLGMTVVTAWEPDERSFVHLDAGDGSIVELMQDDKPIEMPTERGVHWHLALRTTRIEAVMARVEEAGMEVTVPVKAVTLTNTATDPPSAMPIKVAFFIGPSGEVVELFQDDGN